MSRLHQRIRQAGPHAHRQAMSAYTPVTPGAAASGSAASPGGTPGVMPLARILVYPQPAGYATIAYEGLAPIFTTGGEAIPASSPGRWAQLAAAGRP